MTVSVRIAVLYKGKLVTQVIEGELAEGGTIQGLFKGLEKSKAVEKKLFKNLFRSERTPTVLHNGTRLRIPKGLDTVLSDGDELSVLTPFAGG